MKLTASILLILIIGSSLFYYGYFDMMLLHSKEKAMQSIKAAENNHTLKIFKVPLTQEDKYSDDEIRIDGDLYDVGEREITGDTLYLSVYHDTDEQNVLDAISDFFKTDDTAVISAFPNSPSLKNVRIIYNPRYYFDALYFSLRTNSNSDTGFRSSTALISFPFYDIITPPPRLS